MQRTIQSILIIVYTIIASGFLNKLIFCILILSLLLKVFSEYGSYWTQTSAPNGTWYAIAISSSGQVLAAAQNEGYIYISTSG